MSAFANPILSCTEGNIISAEISHILARISQTLSMENKEKLANEYTVAKNDADLIHWIKEFPLDSSVTCGLSKDEIHMAEMIFKTCVTRNL